MSTIVQVREGVGHCYVHLDKILKKDNDILATFSCQPISMQWSVNIFLMGHFKKIAFFRSNSKMAFTLKETIFSLLQ